MKSDEELKKNFKLSVDKAGIIDLTFLNDETDPDVSIREAQIREQAILEIFNKDPEKIYNGIVDFSPIGDSIGSVPKEAREIYARLIFNKQVNSIAMVGSNKFYQVVVNLILEIYGKSKNVKWFSNREDALAWLKGKKL